MKQIPIQLIFKVKFAKLKDEVEIKVWTKDNYAITWMSNSEVLKRLVTAEKRQGSLIETAYDKDGNLIAIQKYKGMKSKEIAKKISKELEIATGGNLKKL